MYIYIIVLHLNTVIYGSSNRIKKRGISYIKKTSAGLAEVLVNILIYACICGELCV